MDKFAFGRAGLSATRSDDLDARGPATGTCPPPPPPVPPAYTRTGAPLATGKDKFLGSARSPGGGFAELRRLLEPGDAGKRRQVGRASKARATSYNLTQARPGRRHRRRPTAASSSGTCCSGVTSSRPGCGTCRRPNSSRKSTSGSRAIAAEFPDLEQIEVVNEPLHDPPDKVRPATRRQGGSAATTKRWAAPAPPATTGSSTRSRWRGSTFPNAKLMLNDYSITNDGNATTRYLQIIKLLKERGLIDLVGVQGHAFEFNYNDLRGLGGHTPRESRPLGRGGPADLRHRVRHRRCRRRVESAGRSRAARPLPGAVPGVLGKPGGQGHHACGATCRAATGARAAAHGSCIPNGAERPALQWLVRYVENNPPTVVPGQSFTHQ